MKTLRTVLCVASIFICMQQNAISQTNIFPSTGSAGIGTTAPSASSALEIKSNTQGLLIPRMTKANRDGISSPVKGLLIFQTNGTPGFYYYDGLAWQPIVPVAANTKLSNLANTSINADLVADTTALRGIGTPSKSWKKIYLSGPVYQFNHRALVADTLNFNVFVGTDAGFSDIQSGYNTATGYQAMYMNQYNGNCTAIGYRALYSGSSIYNCTAIGYEALFANVAYDNTAIGSEALHSNYDGQQNTAIGAFALASNTGSSYNTAIGYNSLSNNTAGYNTSIGVYASSSNTTGDHNTSIGCFAGTANSTGSNCTAIGAGALFSSTAGNNTGIGTGADVAAGLSNCTAIGSGAYVAANNQAIVGNLSVVSIGGIVGWSNFSDGRFKTNIKENVPGLSFINQLKAVTYNLDIKKINEFRGKSDSALKELDIAEAEKIIRTGFIAQDVETAAKNVGYDFDGVHHPANNKDNYSLTYADFVPSLVKAVQELSIQNTALKTTNDNLQKQIDQLTTIVNQLAKNSNISTSKLSTNTATLAQNTPNPGRQSTTISYYIPKTAGSAMLKITALNGENIKTQNLTTKGSGTYTLQTANFAAGTYTYSLYVDGNLIDTKKLEVIK